MNPGSDKVHRVQTAINRAALALSVILLIAIGAIWLSDRTREWETPRWDAARFVTLRPPAGAVRAAWVVAVNPDCGRCRARLADLQRRRRDPGSGPALGALIVDVRRRPDAPGDATRLDGGVYWDSLHVWRERWGHRVYGEVLVFDARGVLERTVGPEADPAEAPAR